MVPRGALIALALLVAGCASTSDGSEAVQDAPEAFMLAGIVVSETIVPIKGASVVVEDGLNGTTDGKGRFEIGPVEPGTYRLAVRAQGYADATVTTSIRGADDELLKVVMVPVTTDVPYHDTVYFQGYLECTFDIWVSPYQILGAPCIGLVDVVTGETVSNDDWQFVWAVEQQGLEGILIEMVWEEQSTGSWMGLLMRNVVGAGGGVDAGGTNIDTQYFSTRSESPMRAFVYQGIENPGADNGAVFQQYQNETGNEYKIMILGRADYSQPADVHLMLQNDPEIFLTRFYNAMGGESFSVLG